MKIELSGKVENMEFSEQHPTNPYVRINADELEDYLEVIGPFIPEDINKTVKITLEW